MQMVQEKKEVDLPEKHRVVADCIRVGRDNATLVSDICIIADIEKRTVYKIISDLINNYGYVIVASRHGRYKGYFYPENEYEFKWAIRSFKSEFKSMKQRYENLVNNYKNIGIKD